MRNMTILKGEISKEINQKFRQLAMQRFNYEKGAISNALEEAIIKWIEDQQNVNVEEDIERAKNNKLFKKEKKNLLLKHPNKFVTICNGKIVEIGDNLFETVEKTKQQYPDTKHCLIYHTSLSSRRKARLGWRIKRIQKS